MTPVDGRSARASKRRENRRRAILLAARRVFAERGYHKTHVSDLIAAAGIARGTFYLYFESKEAVFIDLLDELLGELRQSIIGVETAAGSAPVQKQLIHTMQGILAKVVDNRRLTTIIFREAVGLDAQVDERLNRFYSELLDYIRKALDEGKSMGIIREIDTEIAAFCILGTVKQLTEQLVQSDESETIDVNRLALAVLDFNLRGLLKL